MLKLPVNEGIEEELEEILQTNDLAEARKFVVDYLVAPLVSHLLHGWFNLSTCNHNYSKFKPQNNLLR
eukprot:1764478-Amphidinium_carterae.1